MNNDRLTFRTPYYLPNPDGKNEFVGFAYWDATTGRPNMMVVWGNDEQCTGLRDENDNLIYEGDIIKCEIDIERELSVVWDDGCFGVYVPTHDDFVKFYTLGNFTKHEWEVKNIEIIGNIHEQKDKQ